MSIKHFLALALNLVILLTTLLLSFFFYREFKSTLEERVILHLTSIKRLKRLQVERHLKHQWNDHLRSVSNRNIEFEIDTSLIKTNEILSFIDSLNSHKMMDGIYDISNYNLQGDILLLYYKSGNVPSIKVTREPEIQEILLERTGMGLSGETYLVGKDSILRSQSRFLSNKRPNQITCKSEGLIKGLSGTKGNNIIKDYRGIEVYSVYHKLFFSNIRWVILSEIDKDEIQEPLLKIRKRLLIIIIIILCLTFLLSLWLTGKLSKNITKVSNLLTKIANGNYENDFLKEKSFSLEINQLYSSLEKLYKSLNQAIRLANEIGNRTSSNTNYIRKENDPLIHALYAMQDKLEAYHSNEKLIQKEAKVQLVKGQELERNRLSRDLHDGIGPLLTSLKLTIQNDYNLSKKEDLKNIIDQTINEVRRISYDIMPLSLIDFGVAKAISYWIDLLKKNTFSNIEFISDVSSNIKDYKEVNICLYRVSQELINNSLKHAHASKIKLSITQFDDKFCLYFVDNGKGFDVKNAKKGAGLKNMKERVDILKGFFHISTSHKGVIVEVELPLD